MFPVQQMFYDPATGTLYVQVLQTATAANVWPVEEASVQQDEPLTGDQRIEIAELQKIWQMIDDRGDQ